MNLYSYVGAFLSLLLLVCVSGDIIRGDNYFEGEFSNNHKGRMLRVLMVFNDLPLDKCVVKCIQHIRCKTVNYNFEKVKCELTDVDFNDEEADKLSYDWYNVGTPSKVDGAWGPWRNITRCSAKCGGGTMNQARDCNSPKPQHGGGDCVGKGERTIDCNTHLCQVINIALNKTATQSGLTRTFKASNGNDGNVNTYSMTSVSNPPYWQVDLGTDVKIEYMIFRAQNRALNNVRVLGKRNYNENFQKCKNLGDLKVEFVEFSCDSNHRFRFIKIETSPGFLVVSEFEVYTMKD